MKWWLLLGGVVGIPYVTLALATILCSELRRRALERQQPQPQPQPQRQVAELADGMLHGEPTGTTPATYCPECAKASVLGGRLVMPPHGSPELCARHSTVAVAFEPLLRRVPVARLEAEQPDAESAFDVWQREAVVIYTTPDGERFAREWFYVDPVDVLWN